MRITVVILSKHFITKIKYEDLFDNIDVTQSGAVDWDKFASYILIMLYESDDRLKAFSIPNWKPIKQIHKYFVKTLFFLMH